MNKLISKARNIKIGDALFLVVNYKASDDDYEYEEYLFKYSKYSYSTINTRKLIGLTRSEAISIIEEELLNEDVQGEIL